MKYKEDILQGGFEQRTLELKDDYEGKVISTLVRKISPGSSKAILYIHGFNDYFFQEEMARKFNKNGFNFYAVDLRKYGRSHLPHQKFNDTRDLKSYYEEINLALKIIITEKNDYIILMGHSTGGLIATLYAKEHASSILFNGLILNSPFFKFNIDRLSKIFLPVASCLGKFFPRIRISGGFTKVYGETLHQLYGGEWTYKLEWKPNIAPKVNLGWIRAIYTAQRKLKSPFKIDVPVLVLFSDKSTRQPKSKTIARTHDIILNVKDIQNIAANMTGDVTMISITDGIHDLVLSTPTVRNNVYKSIFDWLKQRFD